MSTATASRNGFDLVGRERELARLAELVGAVRADGGRARALLVTGPAGVGKSRLLAELKRRLREDGETVFEGRCHATDRRPYSALLEVLGGAATLLGDLGHPAPALERALGHLAGLAGERPAPGDPGAEDALLRFCESVRQALIEVARVRLPILMLHDLHHADAATAGLLRYLLENLLADPAFDWAPDAVESAPQGEGFRGLLVFSFREAPATRPFVELARASAVVEHLPLEPLGAEGVAAFLQQKHIVERLLAATGGLPAALEQIVESIPTRPDALWARRLEAVPKDAEPLLAALAVYERPVTQEQLVELAGPGVPPLLPDLVASNVLARGLERGAVRFRFAREGLREAWYAGLDPEVRRSLHRRVARRLADLVAMGAEPEEVAHHFLAAGHPEDAVPFALDAAERLERAFAFARAAELLERVAAAATGPVRARILDRLAALYLLAGERGRSREALETLGAEFPDHLEPGERAERLARIHLAAGEPQAALARVDEGLAAGPPPDRRLRLQALGAEAAYQAGDPAEAERRAADLPDGADPSVLGLRNTLGKVHLAREALDEAQALFERNLAAAREAGDARAQARALINLGIVHLQRGEPDAAAARFEDARRLAEHHGDLRHLAIAVGNLAVLHHRRQNYRLALDFYHRSSAAFRKLGHQDQLTVTVLNLADLYLTIGDRERARRLADIAAAHVRRGRFKYLETQVTLLEGDLARAEGDADRATGHYTAALGHIEQGSGNNQRLGPLLLSLAEMQIEAGDLGGAERFLDRAAALPEASRTDALEARLRMLRGAVAAAPASARIDLEAAVGLAEQAGDREVRWIALWRLGVVRWTLGDRAGTLQALVEAVETIEQLAAELPRGLRAGYREAPSRRAVHEALRRVRAGLPPQRPASDKPRDTPAMRRAESEWQASWGERYPDIIGRSPTLFPLFKTLDRVAGSDSMVLIRGESGTGKELVAQALHAHSPRAQGPFVRVNCGAFVETLLLSELFGHEKGAFTGALARKKGRFELADAGTIFLDEIGDITPNTQVALLRVLQEGTFERVGGSETLRVEVRVIAATHRNLEDMVRRGEFRADLYYRLRGVVIELPPLRERRDDIPRLVRHFLARRADAEGRPLAFTREALASLLQHDWPGNIRELENVVRSVALFADGPAIGLTELAELGDIFRPPGETTLLDLAERLTLEGTVPPPPAAPAPEDVPFEMDEEAAEDADDDEDADGDGEESYVGFTPKLLGDGGLHLFEGGDGDWLDRLLQQEGSLSDVKGRIEYELIARALRATDGNITQAARRLGMKRPRLSQIIHATPALGDLKREVKS
jgi:transcriptional regulator with GAF, ATPase, and Fis domain/tetratricopeptide (TPR) repeat protein